MNDKENANSSDIKTNLECEKLKAEIEQIRKPFFVSPPFYASISPVILAVLGLIFTWHSGWFDVQRTRITNEKTLLQAETEKLKQDRQTLEAETHAQREHVAALEKEVSELKPEKNQLTNQIARLEKERNEMRSAKEYFESEASRLAGSQTNSMKLLADLKAAQAERSVLFGEAEQLKAERLAVEKELARRNRYLNQLQKNLKEGLVLELAEKKLPERMYLSYIGKVNAILMDMELDEKNNASYSKTDAEVLTNGPAISSRKPSEPLHPLKQEP